MFAVLVDFSLLQQPASKSNACYFLFGEISKFFVSYQIAFSKCSVFYFNIVVVIHFPTILQV